VRSVVVCESWFGNTKRLAEAVAEELARHGDAWLVSVDDEMPTLEGVDLVVVGAPTHIHGMSSAMSRRSALEQAKIDASDPGRGVKGWLKALPEVEHGRAATFDTRAHKPAALVGSAAKGIAKRLRRNGFELVAPPESFFIIDVDGPLEEGEHERAADWARRLAEAVEQHPGSEAAESAVAAVAAVS